MQTASGLFFNTKVRQHGKTERGYAAALKQLTIYGYKDGTAAFIETRCSEQFLAGLHSRELRFHLGLFCDRESMS